MEHNRLSVARVTCFGGEETLVVPPGEQQECLIYGFQLQALQDGEQTLTLKTGGASVWEVRVNKLGDGVSLVLPYPIRGGLGNGLSMLGSGAYSARGQVLFRIVPWEE